MTAACPSRPQAAEHLGLHSLQQHCQRLLGRRQSALGVYSLRDVQQANASGKVRIARMPVHCQCGSIRVCQQGACTTDALLV